MSYDAIDKGDNWRQTLWGQETEMCQLQNYFWKTTHWQIRFSATEVITLHSCHRWHLCGDSKGFLFSTGYLKQTRMSQQLSVYHYVPDSSVASYLYEQIHQIINSCFLLYCVQQDEHNTTVQQLAHELQVHLYSIPFNYVCLYHNSMQ